ncbi:MAG: hypothetical protein GY804_05680 [Alphaproteobacteria bacterium]|nr:hypothetical protein [Alphaproteobacteria bacterium]
MGKRHTPSPTPEHSESLSFETPEEAWFWYWTCLNAKKFGPRGGSDNFAIPRSCEINDICVIIKKLYKQSFLTRDHLKVMAVFGKKMAPPHLRFGNSRNHVSLWQEAMDILALPLKQKGIIA